MNNKIYKLGFKTGLLNYIDHETPRVYFIHAGADLVEFDDFCEALTEEHDEEIHRLRKSYADILQRQTDRFLNEKKENDRLRAILRWVVDTDPAVFRSADFHTDCKCHRCAMDAARTELGRDFGEKE